MKTLKFAAAALICVGLTGAAKAGEGYCGPYGCHWTHGYDLAMKHGVKFSHGFFYIGIAHKHFTHKWHNPHFKTDFFWDPYTHMPYFFCAGHGVYYPVSYIHTVGPTAKGPGPFKMDGGKAMIDGKAVPFLADPVGGAGAPVGGPGGAPVGGAPVGGAGAPVGGAGVAPAGGAGKAPVTTPGGAAPAGDAKAAGQLAAKTELPKGTFDDAIPDPVKQ
jgi:hypothetical protein